MGGKARYLYVMEKGTTSPGAPPNLDLPTGVIWRFDVPPTAKQGLDSGTVKYGVVPGKAAAADALDGLEGSGKEPGKDDGPRKPLGPRAPLKKK